MATPIVIQSRLRSLYRSFLRELPLPPTVSSPLHSRLRTSFVEPSTRLSPSNASANHTHENHSTPSEVNNVTQERIQQAEQYLLYFRAQRTYLTLLERYNPGVAQDIARGRVSPGTRTDERMGHRDEVVEEDRERVEATARRVGMVLPNSRPSAGVGSRTENQKDERRDLRNGRRDEDGD